MSIRMKIITAIAGLTLVAVLAPVSAGAYTGIPADFIFTKALQSGSVDQEVVYLKIILADEGCLSGVTNTTLFGPKTKAAVQCFQAKYGTGTLGTVGPNTRAKLNVLLAATPPPTAGCPAGAIYNSITGALCVATPPPTAGCPAGAIYNSITGALCVVTPVVGAEGNFTAVIAGAPASNANIITVTNVPIYGIQIKATSSDMKIDRVDLQLAVTKASSGVHPSTLITGLSVYDGATLLTEKAITSTDVNKDSAGLYYVRIAGINFNVLKDQTKTLTIKANFSANLEADRELTVNVYGSTGIRGVDTAGLSSWALLATTRVHTVKYTSVGSSTLTATASISTPKATTINVDSTDGVEDVPMLVFNLKSTIGASKVTKVKITASGTANIASELTSVKLYQGTTLLGSSSLTSSVATFSDLSVDIAKDATVVLTAKADFAATGAAGRTAILTLTAAYVTYDKPNLATGTTPGTAIVGETMRLYADEVAVFAISTPLSASYTRVAVVNEASESVATGVITFSATADGGTLTKLTSAKITVVAINSAGTELALTSQTIQLVLDTDVPDGNVETVTVNVSKQRGATALGFIYFKVKQIDWVVGSNTVSQTWGLDYFKTPAVNAN